RAADRCRVLLDRPFTGNLLVRKPQKGQKLRLGADFPTRIVAEPSAGRQTFLAGVCLRQHTQTKALILLYLEHLTVTGSQGVTAVTRDADAVVQAQKGTTDGEAKATAHGLER